MKKKIIIAIVVVVLIIALVAGAMHYAKAKAEKTAHDKEVADAIAKSSATPESKAGWEAVKTVMDFPVF